MVLDLDLGPTIVEPYTSFVVPECRQDWTQTQDCLRSKSKPKTKTKFSMAR